jgi:hypothetical protein
MSETSYFMTAWSRAPASVVRRQDERQSRRAVLERQEEISGARSMTLSELAGEIDANRHQS